MIESCLSSSSPSNKEILFLSGGKKTNVSEVSIHRGFSTQFKSNSDLSGSRKHKCPKKRWVTIIQPEDFNELENQLTGSVLQNGCSEKFEKISRKTSWSYILF